LVDNFPLTTLFSGGKMKNVLFLILFLSTTLPNLSFALLTGFDNTSSEEKLSRGFHFEMTKIAYNPNFIEGADFEGVFGREDRAFKLLLNGRVLLPMTQQSDRKHPRVKIGAIGIILNAELSFDVYSELALDYTHSKILEGVQVGQSVIQCTNAHHCSLINREGYFWIFGGHRAQGEGDFFASYHPGHWNYKSFLFSGPVINSAGSFSSNFIKALSYQVLDLAPDTLKFYEITNSSATDSLSYEEHLTQASMKVESIFGSTELERMIFKSLLHSIDVVYSNEIKTPSSSNCTYFCGTVGRFVRASVQAKTDF
jgi:hypothetical protein